MRKFVLFLFLGLLFACKREDETIPEVSIIRLNPAGILQFGDTLWVEVRGESLDNFGLQEVTVQLFDLNQKVWLRSAHKSLNGASSCKVTFAIVLDDRYLPSGNYYMKAMLSDGTQTGTDFVNYTLQECPRWFKGVVALKNNGSNGSSLDSLTVDGSAGEWWSSAGTMSQVVVDDVSQRMWLGGPDNSQCQWVEPNGQVISNQTFPFVDNISFFNDAAKDPNEEGVWLACQDGFIRKMRSNGQLTASWAVAYPYHVALTHEYVMVESEVPGTAERLNVYRAQTGQLMQAWVHGEKVLDVLALDENTILLVVDRTSVIQLLVFDLSTGLNVNWSPFLSFNAQQYHCAALGNDRIALSTDQGITVWNTDGTGQQNYPVYHPDQMEWESNSGALYLLENGSIQAMSLSSGNVMQSWPSNMYERFGLRYNK